MNGVADDCLRISARDFYANKGTFAKRSTVPGEGKENAASRGKIEMWLPK